MKKMDVKRVAAGFAGMMLAFASAEDAPTQPPNGPRTAALVSRGTFTDASAFGFSSTSSGIENARALQQAVDKGGTITVSSPGIYPVSATVYLGSNTSLVFGHGVVLKKTPENGPFTHVFLNKGALTRVSDERISIDGLHIAVNGVDQAMKEVFGLRGQLAFFHARDIRIRNFRCFDLGSAQFCIHVCSFEDLLIEDAIIKGDKDGIHLGTGKRFTIRDCTFQTYDDAIALNAHDYATSNPELGWIEDGVIENCHDLDAEKTTGFFCRILAGAWIDWTPGMRVQQSDTVVSEGRLYRVQMKADGTEYISNTRPTHERGAVALDGIQWGMVQENVTHSAGVKNVVFRDIYLRKARIGFSFHFDVGRYSRSYYPGAPIPEQQGLLFDGIRVLHDKKGELFSIATPVDALLIRNSFLGEHRIKFRKVVGIDPYPPTRIDIQGSVFRHTGQVALVSNDAPGKTIVLRASGNTVLHDGFKAAASPGPGRIDARTDLPGLESVTLNAAAASEKDPRLHSDGKGWRVEKAEVGDPTLPRVLLVGDSILNGYLKATVKALEGKANVDAWVTPGCQSTQYNKTLGEVLEKNGPYQVIHLNTGLHGWQPGRIKEGTFEPLMEALVETVRGKNPGARFIWAGSTPVTVKGKPDKLDPVINPVMIEQNRMAAEVMARLKVPVNDFYGLLSGRLDLARGDQFHWNAPAYQILAEACAKSVLDLLAAAPAPSKNP
jgi:hypothetical protein